MKHFPLTRTWVEHFWEIRCRLLAFYTLTVVLVLMNRSAIHCRLFWWCCWCHNSDRMTFIFRFLSFSFTFLIWTSITISNYFVENKCISNWIIFQSWESFWMSPKHLNRKLFRFHGNMCRCARVLYWRILKSDFFYVLLVLTFCELTVECSTQVMCFVRNCWLQVNQL